MLKEMDLADEVAAFLREKPKLVAEKSAPWALFADGQFKRAFDDYTSAVAFAIDAGLTGRFLVRNIYAAPAQVPCVFAKRA